MLVACTPRLLDLPRLCIKEPEHHAFASGKDARARGPAGRLRGGWTRSTTPATPTPTPEHSRSCAAAPRHRRAFDSSRRTEHDCCPSVSSRRTVFRSSRANDKRSTRRTYARAAGADGDAVSDGGRGGRGGGREARRNREPDIAHNRTV
jgi:hypothetical protein